MRYIKKGAPPESFENWKAMANDNWTASYSNLQNPQKSELLTALLREQGMTCCYCGRTTDERSSHIEHFRPQDTHPDLALEYSNLHASCLRETSPGAPLHCGHAKDSGFDEPKHISPLDANCESRFRYALDGHIYPYDLNDAAASYMRYLLKLDIAFLRDRRAEALQGVFSEDFILSASADDLQRIRESFRAADALGRLPNLGHVVAEYAGRLLEDTTRKRDFQ